MPDHGLAPVLTSPVRQDRRAIVIDDRKALAIAGDFDERHLHPESA